MTTEMEPIQQSFIDWCRSSNGPTRRTNAALRVQVTGSKLVHFLRAREANTESIDIQPLYDLYDNQCQWAGNTNPDPRTHKTLQQFLQSQEEEIRRREARAKKMPVVVVPLPPSPPLSPPKPVAKKAKNGQARLKRKRSAKLSHEDETTETDNAVEAEPVEAVETPVSKARLLRNTPQRQKRRRFQGVFVPSQRHWEDIRCQMRDLSVHLGRLSRTLSTLFEGPAMNEIVNKEQSLAEVMREERGTGMDEEDFVSDEEKSLCTRKERVNMFYESEEEKYSLMKSRPFEGRESGEEIDCQEVDKASSEIEGNFSEGDRYESHSQSAPSPDSGRYESPKHVFPESESEHEMKKHFSESENDGYEKSSLAAFESKVRASLRHDMDTRVKSVVYEGVTVEIIENEMDEGEDDTVTACSVPIVSHDD